MLACSTILTCLLVPGKIAFLFQCCLFLCIPREVGSAGLFPFVDLGLLV